MVTVEKVEGLHFKTVDAVLAVDFQPQPPDARDVQRLAAAAGAFVKIWSLYVGDGRSGAQAGGEEGEDGAAIMVDLPPEEKVTLKDGAERIVLYRSGDVPDEIVLRLSRKGDVCMAGVAEEQSRNGAGEQLIEKTDNSNNNSEIGFAERIQPSIVFSSEPEDDLSGKGGGCRTKARCVGLIRDHAPQYLVCVRWSPCGHLLASCDSHCIIISELAHFTFDATLELTVAEDGQQQHLSGSRPPQGTKDGTAESSGLVGDGGGNAAAVRYLVTRDQRLALSGGSGVQEEIWKTKLRMSDPQSDIFDMAWCGSSNLVTGGIDCIKIWDMGEKGVMQVVQYGEGFVKGVCCFGRNLIGAQSNGKRALVWARSGAAPFRVVVDDQELFKLGPSDLPYFRRGSFDPAGKFVAFPFAAREAQCFGAIFPIPPFKSTTSDHEGGGSDPPCALRMRGHLARINCVSFSRGVWVAQGSGAKFTLYAQASLDGVLSIWKFFYPGIEGGGSMNDENHTPDPRELVEPDGDLGVKAKCILILTQRFLDEQASVVDMTWTPDGLTLAIGADDGSITLVIFDQDELEGAPLPNARFWQRILSQSSIRLPPDPRHPQSQFLILQKLHPPASARKMGGGSGAAQSNSPPPASPLEAPSELLPPAPPPLAASSQSEVTQVSAPEEQIRTKKRLAPTLVSTQVASFRER